MAAASSAPEQPAPFETAQRCPVNQDFLVSGHEAWQAASGTNDRDLIGFGLLRTQSDHVVCEDCKGKIAHHETKEEKQKRKERGGRGLGNISQEQLLEDVKGVVEAALEAETKKQQASHLQKENEASPTHPGGTPRGSIPKAVKDLYFTRRCMLTNSEKDVQLAHTAARSEHRYVQALEGSPIDGVIFTPTIQVVPFAHYPHHLDNSYNAATGRSRAQREHQFLHACLTGAGTCYVLGGIDAWWKLLMLCKPVHNFFDNVGGLYISVEGVARSLERELEGVDEEGVDEEEEDEEDEEEEDEEDSDELEDRRAGHSEADSVGKAVGTPSADAANVALLSNMTKATEKRYRKRALAQHGDGCAVQGCPHIHSDIDRPMICCDSCNQWHHYECADVSPAYANATLLWHCSDCGGNTQSIKKRSFRMALNLRGENEVVRSFIAEQLAGLDPQEHGVQLIALLQQGLEVAGSDQCERHDRDIDGVHVRVDADGTCSVPLKNGEPFWLGGFFTDECLDLFLACVRQVQVSILRKAARRNSKAQP